MKVIAHPPAIPTEAHDGRQAEDATILYAGALAAVERRLVEALPGIAEGLIARARAGDAKAAVYMCDRILGRAAGSAVAPADDRQAPCTEGAFLLDQQDKGESDDMRRQLGGFGAIKGA
ncbi:MAG: hypothetical protein JO252_29610 [Planctomycetaceae bacterium]|nr:hypothetical protein [Planctomycetaceae bacterium]